MSAKKYLLVISGLMAAGLAKADPNFYSCESADKKVSWAFETGGVTGKTYVLEYKGPKQLKETRTATVNPKVTDPAKVQEEKTSFGTFSTITTEYEQFQEGSYASATISILLPIWAGNGGAKFDTTIVGTSRTFSRTAFPSGPQTKNTQTTRVTCDAETRMSAVAPK